MEIEAKFQATPADLALIAELRSLGPYQLTPAPAPELQENRYFDTADGRLSAAQHGLRVRRIGERALITFKGPASVSADGVFRRVEHEFPGDDPHPSTWPRGEARELALALIGAEALVPTVAVSTQRTILYADRDGVRVAELCLDRGLLRGGARERPFCELEVELLADGQQADLDALLGALRERLPLTPEPRGKLQRALTLRDEEQGEL